MESDNKLVASAPEQWKFQRLKRPFHQNPKAGVTVTKPFPSSQLLLIPDTNIVLVLLPCQASTESSVTLA